MKEYCVREESLDKLILVAIIGLLDILKEHIVTVDEASMLIFSPYMVNKLREEHYSLDVISIVERGCELEDILSLLPERLEIEIDLLRQQAVKVLKQKGNKDRGTISVNPK